MKPSLLKETIKQWAVESRIHGISNIIISKSKILRIIWISCFLVSFSYCFYQLINTFMDYLNFNVISNYHNQYEVPTQFPTVDICNLNPYDGNQLHQLASIINSSYVDESLKNQYYIEDINTLTESFKSYLEHTLENNKSEFYIAGFYFYQMMLSCIYNNQPCLQTDFQYYHNYFYGSCYSFNVGYDFWNNPTQLRYSKQGGAEYGLQLELFVGDYNYQQLYTYLSGIKVLIRNKSSIPFPEELGIEISPGTQTNIAVSKLYINHLPMPYNDCIDEISNENYERNDIFKILKIEFNKTNYEQVLCLKMCTQLYVIKKCQCFDYSLPNISSIKINGCYSQNSLKCMKINYEYLFRNFVELCDKNCPMQCSQIVYNTAISFSNYPTKWYSQKLIQDNGTFLRNLTEENQLSFDQWSFDYLQQTTLKLNIFYDDLTYTIVDEIPALTIENLIAYIGGNLGLFLGMSLLSLIETFELVFYIICDAIMNK